MQFMDLLKNIDKLWKILWPYGYEESVLNLKRSFKGDVHQLDRRWYGKKLKAQIDRVKAIYH